MLARLRIGPKLLLAPGVVLVLLIMLWCGAYDAMVRQNDSLETIVHQRSASGLVATAQHAHTEIYRLLTRISGSYARARIDSLVGDIHAQHAEAGRGFAKLGELTRSNSAEHRLVQQAEAAHQTYVRAVLDVIETARLDRSISAAAMSKAEQAFAQLAERLRELSTLQQELSQQASERAAADFRTTSTLMPLVVVLSIALSLAITMAVRRALLGEIAGIGAAAIELASGDLTVKDRVYGNDEIAETSRALDTSIRNLNGMLRTILESARSIGSASREIALGNAGGPTRAAARGGALEQALQELTATVNLTADSALAANRLAESASSSAHKGESVVERLVLAMDSVKGSSRRVEDIIGTIDAIASRTGMLALNAAVAAAGAGEQGRDFAIVASEVRLLAQRCALAAHEIRELVTHSVAEIDSSTATAREAGSSMAEIASSVQQAGDMISRIGCANAEQASGLSEMNQVILQMDQMTQQNGALVEEAATAAQRLQQQALTLSRAVAMFRLDEAVQDGTPEARAQIRDLRTAPRKGRHPYLRLASSRN